ncbi:hypothetical protein NPIL_205431 [Nephila pilipes]|uniref:Uncharacterized protein n=1 Tax=Nephila pilipes TaxID=299642 RepID=A0A8X6I620_NEPPI|nr:hypothetical protein NPIL_205431 [Nephila pilipes]
MPPYRCGCSQAPGRPRILRAGKRGHPRKEYGQVSIITDCFEASPSFQEALARPIKIHWKNTMKEEHDALAKENAWTLVSRPKHKKARNFFGRNTLPPVAQDVTVVNVLSLESANK